VKNLKDFAGGFLWFAGVTFIAGILYLKTACPTVEFIDSGELAVNCLLLGIPHPTGYPLYMFLGRIAVILLPGEIIFRCNLLSLIVTSLSVGVLFNIIKTIHAKSHFVNPAAALLSLFVALLPVWWSQATSNEVYCITLLADLLAISFFIKYYQTRKCKFLISGFYLWGLSFGSHMSTIFLLPAITYIIISTDGLKRIIKRHYFWAFIFFILSLTTYIYLPIRAAFKPFLNWSNPVNLQGFLNHISGWQYRVWMFSSLTEMLNGISYFLHLLYDQFGIVGLALMTVGMIVLFKNELKVSIFFTSIILADIFYSSNYEIIDIDAYYLIGFACLAVFAGTGLIYLVDFLTTAKQLKRYKKTMKIFLIFCLVGLPLSNLLSNYYTQDKSNKVFAAKGVENMLASMEPGGMAIIENWDFYSPWLYFRYALNHHPYITLIDKELLRRSWYLDFLQRYHPEITGESQTQIERFLELLKPFEAGKKCDPNALTASFREMISSIIKTNARKRPIYTNITHDPDVVPYMARIPVGVLYKLEDKPSYIDFDINKIDISCWELPYVYINERTKIALAYSFRAFKARELFCRNLGHINEAEEYSNLSSRIEKILSKPEG